ncbi:MAG: signal peptidase I [Elusimicrobia bacterium]|nr:signal peptidase I [Elusimicrobiota bacterium]
MENIKNKRHLLPFGKYKYIKDIKDAKASKYLLISILFFLSSCAGFHHGINPWCPDEYRGKTQKVIVRGNSLYPLIKNKEEVKLRVGYYKKRKVGRGDIIAFKYPGRETPVIKIVKAVGGDKFLVKERDDRKCELIINGDLLKDWRGSPYIFSNQKMRMLKLYEKDYKGIVPDGFYLVFGTETCDACLDSGKFGFLDGNKIIGKIK